MDIINLKETYPVRGMTCVGCERRIEKILSQIDGVDVVQASFPNAQVTLAYDHDLVKLDDVKALLDADGYTLMTSPADAATGKKIKMTGIPKPDRKAFSLIQLIGVMVILIAIYLLVENTIGFNVMPDLSSSMGYGVLFVVGLFTSLHCVSMCGGINISQSVYYAKPTDVIGTKMKVSGMYNLGRIISYTLVGGIVGALGSVIELTGWARGLVAVLSGLFMVVLGISMLGFLPRINQLAIRMPRFLQVAVGKASRGKGPLIIGLATGLMPCGPLQAMQIYALGTGSPLRGALSMFFFSLGTVPLMFGLGAVSTLLSSKFTSRMLKVSAILVLVLGVIMANRGFVLSGVNAISLPLPFQAPIVAEAQIEEGVQRLTSKVLADAYPEIKVKAGIPVVWTLQVAEEDLNSCNNEIVIPAFDITKPLQVGDNIIEFTPLTSGTIPYSCWMGMIDSKIHVD